jgi:hypothetical protein
MKLTLLATANFTCLLGSDEGQIYTVPQGEMKNVDLLEPVHWPNLTVLLPRGHEDLGDGRVQLQTRSLHLRLCDTPQGVSACVGFDDQNKIWYINSLY